ncbi:MAG: TIGR01548 family HAD-type hydrolase [Cyanobacteria bacterium QH_8_48_120]|nr:MAG: TIGR01548 family HAD-type hydrolase [Cyanobacteria bacterium QH_8_48_120]
MLELLAIVVFDIDGVVRDVGGSYRRALADTVEYFTDGAYRPTPEDIDQLKSEGIWNNDWEASQELIYRHFQVQGQERASLSLNYEALVAFFQSRYRGPDSENWTGYICQEPLLLQPDDLARLSASGIAWGFFSGATRASAEYVLSKRLALPQPVLMAMEDAPGKPDPAGLFETVCQIEQQGSADASTPAIYVGDTVADMYTVGKARELQPGRDWIGVGILPPHIAEASLSRREAHTAQLKEAGAAVIYNKAQALTPVQIQQLVGD